MDIKVLNRGEAQKAMQEWINNYPELPAIDKSYVSIRSDIQEMNRQIRKDAESLDDAKYYIDAHLGLSLYEYLWYDHLLNWLYQFLLHLMMVQLYLLK